jgi:ATP-dependent exoDNAse (exonuclease V) beta subunit
LTYHKSKGLEYPVTICHGLKGDLKERVWGINLVPESDTIDLNDILGGRWLRFWVNPYADQEKGTRLLEALQVSPEWAAANKHALAEEARLMYVGLTRARDYLVFPSTIKPLKWLNRVFNKGDETIPTLDPYSDETPFYWNDAVIKIQTDNIYREKDFAEAHIEEPAARFHDNRSGKRSYFPYKIDPLAEVPPGFEPKFKEAEWWTTLPANFVSLNETQQVSLQKALHAVLLADNLRYPSPERLDIAKLQLQIRELPADNIRPEDVSKISESFFYFLKNRFAPKKLDRKMPFRYFFQDRLVEIEADFLLETDTEVIVGQMAPCTEGKKDLKKTAQNMAPLLAWFKMGCQRSFPNKTVVSGVIFPSEGAFLEILTQ